MRCTLEVIIDDDALRASGMAPEAFLRRTMGSLQEYGIRFAALRETGPATREDPEGGPGPRNRRGQQNSCPPLAS